jgi:hypothetical protein
MKIATIHFLDNRGSSSYENNSVSESPRLFELMSERPSTSKGFSHQYQQDQNNRRKPDSKSSSRSNNLAESNHVIAFKNNSVYPSGSGSNHLAVSNFGNQDVGRQIDGAAFLADVNSPEGEREEATGFVVESEPSKFKPFQRLNDGSDLTAKGNSSNNDQHFDDSFLPDFDPSNEGNLPTIDAGASFGQPVDLEDIQVQH